MSEKTCSTRPKPFVFVLMPFEEAFDDVYQLGIKPACENSGAYAERVDEQMFEGSILQRIYNQIAKADVVIADMTDRNPNVFYETGYAHALGKNVILLTQNSEDIPFDLKHYPHIVYRGKITSLIPDLERRIRWCIEHPDQSEFIQWEPKFYVDGTEITPNRRIPVHVTGRSSEPAAHFELCLDINNPADRIIKTATLGIGYLTTDQLKAAYRGSTYPEYTAFNAVKQPGGYLVHIDPESVQLLP